MLNVLDNPQAYNRQDRRAARSAFKHHCRFLHRRVKHPNAVLRQCFTLYRRLFPDARL